MSDRIKGFIVTLEHDISEDQANWCLQVFAQIRGVASVKPEVANYTDGMNRERIKSELRQKLLEVLE